MVVWVKAEYLSERQIQSFPHPINLWVLKNSLEIKYKHTYILNWDKHFIHEFMVEYETIFLDL